MSSTGNVSEPTIAMGIERRERGWRWFVARVA
jgi:hypothetical protein